MGSYLEFLGQMKLQATTKNENGDAASYLMGNWYDMRKEDLAHIAIESMIAAERQIKIAQCGIKELFDDDIAAYYDEIYENLVDDYFGGE